MITLAILPPEAVCHVWGEQRLSAELSLPGGLSQRKGEEKQNDCESSMQPNCPDQEGAGIGTVLRPGPLEIFRGSAETQPTA